MGTFQPKGDRGMLLQLLQAKPFAFVLAAAETRERSCGWAGEGVCGEGEGKGLRSAPALAFVCLCLHAGVAGTGSSDCGLHSHPNAVGWRAVVQGERRMEQAAPRLGDSVMGSGSPACTRVGAALVGAGGKPCLSQLCMCLWRAFAAACCPGCLRARAHHGAGWWELRPWGSPLSPSLCPQAEVEAGKTSVAQRPPPVTHRTRAPVSGTPATSHTLPKAGAGSLFGSLQRRERARAEQARLRTLQGIMGASSLQPAPEEPHGPSSTWPQKGGRRNGGPGPAAAGAPLGELLLYVRNPLARDIDDECGAAARDPRLAAPRATCPRLSLGSVLSLELPRDALVLGCRRGPGARREEVEGQEQHHGGRVEQWQPAGTRGAGWQEERGADGHNPQRPGEGLGMSPKSERGTWFEEVSFNPSYSWQRARRAGEERWSPRHPGSTGEDLDCASSRPSRTDTLGQDSGPGATWAGHGEAAGLELRPSPAGTPGRAGAAPTTARTQRPAGSDQPGGSPASPAAHTQLSVFEWALGSPQPPSPTLGTGEVCHPARGQFEEEEEELQAIWDGAGERRAPSPRAGSLPSPDTAAGRPLIVSAANNVVVAKFTLPAAARLLCSPAGEKSPGAGHSGSPSRHGASPRAEELVSTAPSDGPGTGDRQGHGEEERDTSKVRTVGRGLSLRARQGVGECPRQQLGCTLCLNMRKNFFPLRVTEPWNRLPREAVESPSLDIFKTRPDKVLCSLL